MQFRILFFFAKLDNNLDMYYILQKGYIFNDLFKVIWTDISHSKEKIEEKKDSLKF